MFSPYSSYKDSGVAWLGNIPSHWKVRHSKRLFSERKERLRPGDQQLTASQKFGVIPQADFVAREGHSVVQVITGSEILKHVEPNDFVISMRSFQGGLEYSKYRGCISSAYVMLIPNDDLSTSYFKYLFKCSRYIQALQATSNLVRDGQAMRYANFIQVPLPVLPIEEQKQIGAFLDRETARIDQLIEKKQRLVGVVMERKADFILSAVTRGLGTHSQFSTSGLDWAPELPSHWKLTRLKYLGQAIIGLTYSPEDLTTEGEGVPVLRANNIQAGRLVSSGMVFVSKEVPSKLTLKDGDILICSRNGSRNLIGKNARVSDDFSGMTFGAFNTVFRSKYSDFIYWVLQSPIFSFQAGAYLTSTINQLTVTTLGNLIVPLPPREEQEAICNYIQENISTFDTILEQVRTSIDRLKEYRSALITAAVTGQIDVETWGKEGKTDRRLDQIEEEMSLREALA